MAYKLKKFNCKNSNEREITFCGNFGRKGEKRAPKTKPTEEAVKIQNHKRKSTEVRRLLKINFNENDYWITVKYASGYQPEIHQIKKDFAFLLRKLRKIYREHGAELKYIIRLEISSRGIPHAHMVVNDIAGCKVDAEIKKIWSKIIGNAGIYFTHLYEKGGFKQLADYITKEPKEGEQRQLSLFDIQTRKCFVKYSRSRNLKKPEVDIREYTRRTVEKYITESIKVSEGYYLDKDSVVYGINPYTGKTYLHYTEVKFKDGKKHEQKPPSVQEILDERGYWEVRAG